MRPLVAEVKTRPPEEPWLYVTVVNATGLRNADLMPGQGVSDPFCTCEIVGKPQSRRTTVTIKDSLNPVWGHQFEYADYAVGDCLLFNIWDKDPMKQDDLLGTAVLQSTQFYPNGFDGDLKLSNTGAKNAHSVLKVKVHTRPPSQPPLSVTIVSARGLRNADRAPLQGMSDPRCAVELSGKPLSKVSTRTVKDNVNPVWNHEFKFAEYDVGDALIFCLWDKDPVKQDDLVGTAVLQSTQFHPGGFEGELVLSNGGAANHQGFMRVRVGPAPPPE